jgi:hypothetical protein
MASTDLQMRKQGTGLKKKCGTSTIPHKLQVKKEVKSGENGRQVTASYNVVLSLINDTKQQKGQKQAVMVSRENVKDLSK